MLPSWPTTIRDVNRVTGSANGVGIKMFIISCPQERGTGQFIIIIFLWEFQDADFAI